MTRLRLVLTAAVAVVTVLAAPAGAQNGSDGARVLASRAALERSIVGEINAWRAGENLLWASPEIDADRAVQMWIDSRAHRRILLARDYREIGLSAVHMVAGRGAYEGMEVTIVTADFGARFR